MTISNIYTQLLACNFDQIEKDSKNDFYNSSYVSLPHVLKCVQPELKKNGIIVSFPVPENQPDCCIVSLIHAESSTSVSSHIKLLIEEKKSQDELEEIQENNTHYGQKGKSSKKTLPIMRMQQWGSCMTYAQCRGLLGLLGLAADDDNDGNPILSNSTYKKSSNNLYVKNNKQGYISHAKTNNQTQVSYNKTYNQKPLSHQPKDAYEPLIDVTTPQITLEERENLKKDLKTLWEFKKEVAIASDSAKGEKVKNYVSNNFMMTNKENNLVEVPTEFLFLIQDWLRNL